MSDDIKVLLEEAVIKEEDRAKVAEVIVSYRDAFIRALTMRTDPKIPKPRKPRSDKGTKKTPEVAVQNSSLTHAK